MISDAVTVFVDIFLKKITETVLFHSIVIDFVRGIELYAIYL